MKKSVLFAAAAFLGISLLTGCASSSDPAYLSGIKASDYVELPDYSSIPVTAEKSEISDTLVDSYVDYYVSIDTKTEEVTDRDEVRSGDIVNIDYEGKKDGVAFDGGTASSYDLTIGSGTFIDGFEDGLIGHKVGETLDLDLTFPEDYSAEDLAGQDVVFTVTINSISQSVPSELTDEWVVSQGISGVETVDEYKAYVKSYLESQAQSSYESELEEQIISYLEDNAVFKQDLPAELTERFLNTYNENIEAYAQNYGLDRDSFMILYYGAEEDAVDDTIREMAEGTAKEYVILQAVADKEKLNVGDSEFKTALSTLAASYGYSSVDEFKENEDAEAYREYLMTENVLEFLRDKTVYTPAEDTDAADDAEAEETEETKEAEE